MNADQTLDAWLECEQTFPELFTPRVTDLGETVRIAFVTRARAVTALEHFAGAVNRGETPSPARFRYEYGLYDRAAVMLRDLLEREDASPSLRARIESEVLDLCLAPPEVSTEEALELALQTKDAFPALCALFDEGGRELLCATAFARRSLLAFRQLREGVAEAERAAVEVRIFAQEQAFRGLCSSMRAVLDRIHVPEAERSTLEREVLTA